MRKSAFCIGKNNGADQLRGHHAADQHLSFHFIDSTINQKVQAFIHLL